MDALERARQTRRAIELYAETATDEQAVQIPGLFPQWSAGATYSAGFRTQFEGLLYRCLTAHTSQADWTPADSSSLWVRIDDPSVEWPEWRQPTGATDAYPAGAKVAHGDRRWISDVDNNVWEPGVHGWTEAS